VCLAPVQSARRTAVPPCRRAAVPRRADHFVEIAGPPRIEIDIDLT
jgi:hypothetical protein